MRTVLSMGEASEIETAASVPRPLPLRRNKGFRMLWTGQLLSDGQGPDPCPAFAPGDDADEGFE